MAVWCEEKANQMLEIILKGLFIGFLSSAPMGPVGMLCVQRTLNDGRRHGLVTGLGAAIGDMVIAFFAVVAALGMGFSTDFIQQHQSPLQVVGSIAVIVFGAFVFRKNPSRNLKKLDESVAVPFLKLFISSLLLTISNIATLLLYVALFARFSIIDDSGLFVNELMAVLFIGVGAICWWLLVTYFVDKLRSRFNPRGLKVFNRIVGTILMLVGVVGVITAI